MLLFSYAAVLICCCSHMRIDLICALSMRIESMRIESIESMRIERLRNFIWATVPLACQLNNSCTNPYNGQHVVPQGWLL